MFNVIDINNKLEMQMGKLSKRKCKTDFFGVPQA